MESGLKKGYRGGGAAFKQGGCPGVTEVGVSGSSESPGPAGVWVRAKWVSQSVPKASAAPPSVQAMWVSQSG